MIMAGIDSHTGVVRQWQSVIVREVPAPDKQDRQDRQDRNCLPR